MLKKASHGTVPLRYLAKDTEDLERAYGRGIRESSVVNGQHPALWRCLKYLSKDSNNRTKNRADLNLFLIKGEC
jgi:hypothetical protein